MDYTDSISVKYSYDNGWTISTGIHLPVHIVKNVINYGFNQLSNKTKDIVLLNRAIADARSNRISQELIQTKHEQSLLLPGKDFVRIMDKTKKFFTRTL